MAEPTPVVPTLSGDAYLKDPVRIIAYQLNYYFSAPKSPMVTWWSESVSFKRTLAAWKNGAPEALSDAVVNELTRMFTRIFDSQVQVEALMEENDEDNAGTYTLKVSVRVLYEGNPYTLDQNVGLTSEGHISFELNSLDEGDLPI